MIIAVPCEAPGGLDAGFSAHFGHAPAYTLVELSDGQARELRVIANQGHAPGGCLGPVTMLKQAGVEALVAGGMGARPLAGFQQSGITVYFGGNAGTVAQAVEFLAQGKALPFSPAQVCGGGQGGCGQH